MKVFLGTKKVQAAGRVALDPAALKNAKLQIGDEVEIYFDTDTSAILVEKRRAQEGHTSRRVSSKGGDK